ncbi:MAG: hypothetical protein EBU01_14235, partial [Crocinitomicaceae bacterium]|nr:hypothetical protein [Crocinitomicaceae bacterium]
IVLALLANSNVYGALMALGATAILFLDFFFNKQKGKKNTSGFTIALGLCLVGIAFSVYQIMPREDNSFPVLHPNGLLEVKHLPTGFMMFKRETIEKMMEAYPQSKYHDDVGFLTENEHAFAYNLFDTCIIGTHLYSEDWAFCHKWKEMGGNCYAHIGVNLTHTGQEHFKGSFLNFISSLTYKSVENQP